MQQYLDFLRRILAEGEEKGDRTGTGTISVFGHQMRFDLSERFPAVTTKRVHWPSIIHELLWFLSGDTNVGYLQDNKVRIWNEWADEEGDLGPVYGQQWRKWEADDGRVIDQIENAIHLIRNTPNSRRIIVSPWHDGALDQMAKILAVDGQAGRQGRNRVADGRRGRIAGPRVGNHADRHRRPGLRRRPGQRQHRPHRRAR